MAMDQSLFGPDMATIRDQMATQAIQQGNNLTPTGLAFFGGQMLGRGLGNAMGMEDPREVEAKSVQEAIQELRASGVDMNDPAEYFKKMAGIFGAKGLTKQAEMAAAKALEYQDKKELRQYKLDEHNAIMKEKQVGLEKAYVELAKAKEKSKGKPWEQQANEFLKANFAHIDPESLTSFWKALDETEGNLVVAASKLTQPTKADSLAKTVEAGGRMYVYNPAAAKANPDKTHPTMKDYVDAGAASDRAPKVSLGLQTFDKLQGVRKEYIGETKPFNEVIRNAQAASQLIDNAVSNPASLGPARHAFASVFKVDSQMGKKEIDQLVASGDLPGRLAQGVWGFLSGQLTPTNAAAMKEALAIRERIALSKKAKVQKVYRGRSDLSKTDMDFVTSDAEEVDPSVEPAKPAIPSGGVDPARLEKLLKQYGGK